MEGRPYKLGHYPLPHLVWRALSAADDVDIRGFIAPSNRSQQDNLT